MRRRNRRTENSETIPAIATTIISPIDTRKYIAQIINFNKPNTSHLCDLSPSLITKILEETLHAKETSGNKMLIDTIIAACYVLCEMGRTEWLGGRKIGNEEREDGMVRVKERQTSRKEMSAQTSDTEMGQGNTFIKTAVLKNNVAVQTKEPIDSNSFTNKNPLIDKSNQGATTFADKIKNDSEVQNTVEGAIMMMEANLKHRIKYFTKELDKRIDYMYKEQVHIKEAHKLGLAQVKAGYRLMERKSNLVAVQLEATLGIIAETEKQMEFFFNLFHIVHYPQIQGKCAAADHSSTGLHTES